MGETPKKSRYLDPEDPLTLFLLRGLKEVESPSLALIEESIQAVARAQELKKELRDEPTDAE